MTTCHYCTQPFDRDDLRPYGPCGALICHDCGQATPERAAETEANMLAALRAAEAASPLGIAVLHDRGFDPASDDLLATIEAQGVNPVLIVLNDDPKGERP